MNNHKRMCNSFGSQTGPKQMAASLIQDRIPELIAFYDQDLSYKTIADKLGRGATKNMVIGLCHRLQKAGTLAMRPGDACRRLLIHDVNRVNGAMKAPRPQRSELRLPVLIATPPPQLQPDPDPPEPGPVTAKSPPSKQECAWVLQMRSATGPLTYCGEDCVRGPYCAKHAKVAYVERRIAA